MKIKITVTAYDKERDGPRGYEWAVFYARGRIKKMGHMTDEKEWLMPGKVSAALKKVEQGNAEELVAMAASDAGTFEVLQRVTAYYVERGRVLPEPLQIWAAGILRSSVPEPPKKAGRPKGRSGMQRAILDLVETITKETDLKPTRGNYSQPRSACDAIAEAFRQIGMTPNSFGGVRDAYEAEKRRIREEDQKLNVS